MILIDRGCDADDVGPASREDARGDRPMRTGQIAALLAVAPRTVSKWVDTGKLRGFRLPGSADRRVHPADLVSFMIAGRMFRELGAVSVAFGGQAFLATVHDRWGEPVARLTRPGDAPGSGWDWRPGGDPEYEVRSGDDGVVRMLRDLGFVFEDGR